jgi:hypothetical protein
MSAFFRRWFTTGLLSASFLLVHAQEYMYEIGGMGGGASYMGDANKTVPWQRMNPALGVVFRYNANFRIAFKGDLTWGRVSGSTEGLANVFPNQAQATFSRNLVEMGGQFEYNFFPYSDKFPYLNTKRLSPYLLIGLGVTVAPGNGATFTSLNLPVGAGVKYKLKNRINIGCEFAVRKLFGDGFDLSKGNKLLDNPYGITGNVMKNNDWYSLWMLSVTWDFGPRNRSCNSANSIP